MNLTNQYCYFYDDALFKETDRPGFRRRIINGESMQLCFWRISGGAKGSFLHKHDDNEQFGIIVRGALNMRIDADPECQDRVTIHANEAYLAPRGVWHGDSEFIGDDELNECWILDVFSPPREDYRNG